VSKNASWATGSLKRSAEQSLPTTAPSSAGVIAAAQGLASQWAPTVARVLLGLVLAWFGYHELVAPQLWTGYVPLVSATSQAAIVLVLVHGWVLLMLAVAIIAGVALRLAAALAALMLLQIVITLTITGGLSDLTLRDVGVLGLAVCLVGNTTQRAVLRG
jgi:uncharacterized membrane protein YphA (DoxX/SURF4 family)